MKSLNNNCSVTQFITPERELDKISAAECVLVFHGVKHGHSYRSQDCTVPRSNEHGRKRSYTAKYDEIPGSVLRS